MLVDALYRLDFDGKQWMVTVERYREKRSVRQNKLLMLWMNVISRSRLETHGEYIPPGALKETFKKILLGESVGVFQGEIYHYVKETSSLNTKEFAEFLNQIEIYAATELNIILPRPDDLYWESMGITRRAA